MVNNKSLHCMLLLKIASWILCFTGFDLIESTSCGDL